MKLFRDHLPESVANYDDLQEGKKDLKHFSCLIELEIDNGIKSTTRWKILAKRNSVELKDCSRRHHASKSVYFTIYAPHVFEAFRDSLGISHETFINVRLRYLKLIFRVI